MYKTFLRTIVAVSLIAFSAMPASAGPAEDDYAVAAGHYDNGRWPAAATQFAKFLEEYPDHADAASAIFFLGESLVQQDKYAEARESFLKFLDRDPNHQFARQAIFRVGEASYLAGNPVEAESELNWFRDQYPDDQLNQFALPYLAELAWENEKFETAIAHYKKALEQFPEGPLAAECRFGLARAAEGKGEIVAAIAAYQSIAAGESELADESQLQIGIVQYNARKFDSAEQAFASLVERFSESPLLPTARYWLGMAKVAQYKWTEAAKTLDDMANDYPDHNLAVASLFWAGEALRHQGETKSARDYHQHVYTKWPFNGWADDSLQIAMQLAYDAGQYAEIDEMAERFVEHYPTSPLLPIVRQLHGRSLLKRTQFDKAITVFNDAIEAAKAANDEAESDSAAAAIAAQRPDLTITNWYYLALANLGAERHEETLAALAHVQASASQPELAAGMLVTQAMALIGTERFAEAAVVLRKYLTDFPAGEDAPRCRIHLVAALARAKKLDEAIAVHNGLAETDKQHSQYLPTTYRLAEAAYDAGRYQDAGRLFATVAKFGESDEALAAKAFSGLAWSYASMGDTNAAAEVFGRLSEKYPNGPQAEEAAMMKAKSLAKVGDHAAALQAYLSFVDKHPKSKNAAEATLEAATVQETLGRKTEAVETLEQLLADHPAFARADAARYQLAWLLVDLNQNEKADEIFRRLHSEHKGSRYWADATYRLAERAARNGDFENASRLADELIAGKIEPQLRGHALYLKGQTAASTKHWEDAEAAMQQLLRELPKTSLRFAAEYWIAEANFQLEKHDEALAGFLRLNKQIGDRRDQWLAMIPLRTAQLLVVKERPAEAYQYAAVIGQEFPDYDQRYEADYLVGRCLAMQAKFDEARAMYQRVLQSPAGGKTETAAMAAWMIGESYLHQKKYDHAIDAYHRVVILFAYPRWQAAALLQAGKCYELKGDDQAAIKVLEQLTNEHPDTPFAEEAGQRLRRLKGAARTANQLSNPTR